MTIEQIGSRQVGPGGHEAAVTVKLSRSEAPRVGEELGNRAGRVPASADIKEIQQAVQQIANPGMSALEFSVDAETGKTIVKITDSTTGELIRQIPMEEMLALAKSLDRLQGFLLHTKA